MRQLVFALCTATVLAACGGGSTTGGDDDDVPTDAAELSGEKFSMTWGPVTVPAGIENTQCIWKRLSNTTEIKVHQMHNVLSGGSHHLIVYKDDMDTTEQLTPMPCEPFTGALNASGMVAPLAITQRADDPIFLPEGVAYTFAPGQMVKLEMHYLNRGDTPQDVTATVDFFSADPATIQHEAAILFTGSADIDLAAGPQSLHQFFKVPPSIDLSQSKIFAITGHEHALGTGVKVNVAPAKAGPMTEVYAPDPFSWSEPETVTPAEPFSVPTGGGFDFTCSWNNTTGQNVEFGESAKKEMCFFWAYYYPSQGSKVCIHTDQYGGVDGLDVCCPGDGLCAYVDMILN
jgi:hypothetical protein